MTSRTLLLAALSLAVAACATPSPSHETLTTTGATAGALLVASKAKYLKPDYLGAALVVYALYDPATPNWEVQAADMNADGDVLRLALRMRALHAGGDGEARQVFRRNAERLAREKGYAGYQILAYEEGIESERPIATRVAWGEVQLLQSRALPGL